MADAALAARLQQAGEVIAARARELSSWSERIPGSIRTISRGGDEVLIAAGGPAAPYAITFEAPHAANWRHPVFARGPDRSKWVWRPQIPPRRFLLPAANEEFGPAAKIVFQVVNDWAKMLGWE